MHVWWGVIERSSRPLKSDDKIPDVKGWSGISLGHGPFICFNTGIIRRHLIACWYIRISERSEQGREGRPLRTGRRSRLVIVNELHGFSISSAFFIDPSATCVTYTMRITLGEDTCCSSLNVKYSVCGYSFYKPTIFSGEPAWNEIWTRFWLALFQFIFSTVQTVFKPVYSFLLDE
jgi:hypothetical protein